MKARQSGSFAPAPRRVAASSALASALLSAFAAPALAQDADNPTQQVVISAARVVQRLPDALPDTTVVTRKDIESAPVTDLPGLLRSFTSLNIAQTGPLGAQTSVFMRGANSNQVLVLVDGAPLARADFGSAPWELIPLDQVDHVEIVRGNLSSLYGAQAVGGVVQVFTRKGAGSSLALSAGSQGSFILSGTMGRRIGDAATPLDLSAALSGQSTSGFSARDAQADPSANPDRDPAYQGGATLSAGKTWAPGQRTDFTFMHSYTHSDYDGYTNSTTAQDTLATNLDSFSLVSSHALAPGLKLQLSAAETLEHFTDPTEADGAFGPGSTYGSGRTRVIGAGLDWQLTPAHGLQFGLEDRDERFGAELTPQQSRRTKSVRAGYVGNFADAVDLQADVRHDDADDYGTANTGLLALGWNVTSAWKLVAQFSTAFSAPSFSDEEFAAAGTVLKPQHSRDLELGVHWSGKDWLARATWFSQRQRDLIGFDAQFNTINIGRASNRGVELEADGALGPGRLGLDATFQNARDDDAGTPLSRRARSNAAVNYHLPILGWDSGVWLRYTGKRNDYDPASFSTVSAAARTTVGLSTQHALAPNWTLAFKIDNAANARTPETLGYTAPPRQFLVTLRGQWQ
jgi:vitamin B12 transporter